MSKTSTILFWVVILLLEGSFGSSLPVKSLKIQEQAKMEAMALKKMEMKTKGAVNVEASQSDNSALEENALDIKTPPIPSLHLITPSLIGHRLTRVFVEEGLKENMVQKNSSCPFNKFNSLLQAPASTHSKGQDHLFQYLPFLKPALKFVVLEMVLFFGELVVSQLLISKLKIKMSQLAHQYHFEFDFLLHLFAAHLHYSYFHDGTYVTHFIFFLISVILSVGMASLLRESQEKNVAEVQYMEFVDEQEEINEELEIMVENEQENEQENEVVDVNIAEHAEHVNEEQERVMEVDVEQLHQEEAEVGHIEEEEEVDKEEEVDEKVEVEKLENEVAMYVDEEERVIAPN